MELTELRAYTTYTVHVTACTLAGCTPSPPVSLTTSADLAADLQPATVDNVTSDSVQLAWTDPLLPNGPILRSAALSVQWRQREFKVGGTSLVSRLSACLTEANWWRLIAE